VALTRLPSVAASLSLDRPQVGSFSLLLQWRERNTTKKLGIGKTSRTCKMHSQSSRAVKVRGSFYACGVVWCGVVIQY
jgi:hypothetical protein